MTTVRDPAPPNRRGILVAEVAVLVLVGLADAVLVFRMKHSTGLVPGLLGPLVPSAGEGTAVLAVLRRRFPDRVFVLGSAVAALSLASTGASAAIAIAHQGSWAYPGATEVVAMALLTGAATRRLPARHAAGVALAGVVAMVATPVVRYGIGSPVALLAVPAALLWGAAVAVGLILRDADRRHLSELADVRAGERLQLARELHDLIAHHVSGIVVRAQAAKAIAENPSATAQDPVMVYTEIEQAGTEALTATRRLVGMLRASEPVAVMPGSGVGDAVRAAVDDHGALEPALDIDIADELDGPAAPPELVITVHRLVLEALTNVRRHAPNATRVTLGATVDTCDLVLDIHNDGAGARPGNRAGSGYGLVGMAERVAALGGTLRAGPERGRSWRLTARLPLERTGMLTERPKGTR
ncbi:sensor histidine kinase [Amycolatopsis pigmentata]|uniref:histidine kinase n=1 Tax=Amycolatopsis pigmentata TaxID=450801 RepID=A0ABW5G467_9PSEU